MEKVFLNGQIVSAAKAAVPVTDSSYLYGIGLFETMRAVGGTVFRLDDHLQRLNKSAETLAIANSYSDDQIRQAIDEVLTANKLSDARLRLQVSNGAIGTDGTAMTNLLVTAAEFAPYPAEYYEKGVRVALFLAEGSISNVFLVKDGALYTPPTETPVLPGIARKTVIEIAEAESIPCHERLLQVSDLLTADEVFLTNVVMEVLPVTSIEAHTVADGKPGKITKSIAIKYKDHLKEG
jgi:branched-chain amino acid aminotransferase